MNKIQHEVYCEENRHLTIEVKDGKVEAFEEALEKGKAARVIDNGRLGFAFSTLTGTSDDELIKRSREVAGVSIADPNISLPSGGQFTGGPFEFADIGLEAKKALCLRLEACAMAHDKRIKRARRPTYREDVTRVTIRNSNGVDVKFSHGIFYVGITIVAEGGGVSEWASEDEYALSPGELDVEAVATAAAVRALQNLGGRKIKSCNVPCLLDRRVVSQMLMIAASSFFADAVYKKRSIFAEKLGDRIYSPLVTLVSDPTFERGFSSVPFDAEGSKTRRVAVVNGGKLESFLYDSIHARRMGCESTGSSIRASLMQLPRIGPRNFHILPGKKTFDELLKEMGRGLYVTDLLGLHTANAVTGEFSVGASGFWVDGGRRDHAVKGVTIAGNLHDLFKKTIGVASDLKFWYSSGAPSLLIEEIAISGA